MRKCEEKSLLRNLRENKGKYDYVPKFKPPIQDIGLSGIVRPIIQDAMKRMYTDMNDYLGNIFNSPSTINRVMKYYHPARMIGDDKEYIAFVRSYDDKAVIVREYDLDEYVHTEEMMQMIKVWVDSDIPFRPYAPNLIAPK